MDVELIPVKVPPGDREVRLPNFRWPGSKEDLEHEIESKMSHFGPIHRISVYRAANTKFTGPVDDDTWFAYISFYSARDQKTAINEAELILGEEKVAIKKKLKKQVIADIPLPLYKAQDLLTHYFGFNCWSSEVVYLERDQDVDGAALVRFVCLVRVRIPREDLCSEGVGVGDAPLNDNSPLSRGCSFSCARKFAFQSAMKAAFAKFIIIRLDNKITAEVDTTQCDPLLNDPVLDNTVVKVNDVTYDPVPNDDDEDDGLAGISEEDLIALLDGSANELL